MQVDETQNDPRLLAGLMALAGGGESAWSDADLASIWRHQLVAPLAFDLGGMSRDAEATVATLCDSESIKTFRDLMSRPSPPLELVQIAKDFAKSKRLEAHSAYPEQAAVALYYAAIALALVRLNCRISRMADTRLRGGMEWMTRQAWLDADTLELAGAALKILGGIKDPAVGRGTGTAS